MHSCSSFFAKASLLLSLQCITTEQTPKNPCARCAKRNLRCEYFQAPDQSPDISESEFPPASSSVMPRYSLPSQPESWPSTSPLPSSSTLPHSWNPPLPHRNLSSNRERGGTLPLPYTGPPPRNRIPRYTGTTTLTLLPPTHPPRCLCPRNRCPVTFRITLRPSLTGTQALTSLNLDTTCTTTQRNTSPFAPTHRTHCILYRTHTH
jgi:hypothetical protein